MDPTLIADLVLKGIGLANTLIEAGALDKAKIALGALKEAFISGEPSQADMDKADATLDALFDEFNKPLNKDTST